MNNLQKIYKVSSKFIQFFNCSCDGCKYEFQFEYNMVKDKHSKGGN
jgi:hypothetical protein